MKITNKEKTPTQKITNYVLTHVREKIEQNSSYKQDEQERDEFTRLIMRAVTCCNVALFKELILQNNQRDSKFDYENLFKTYHVKEDLSILHTACENGRIAMIEMLIRDFEFQKEINSQDNKQGKSAFFLAVQSLAIKDSSPQILQFMIDNGADVLALTKDGKSLEDFFKLSQIDNQVTKFFMPIYHKKLKERNIVLASWILFYCQNMENNQNFSALSYNEREQILEQL